MTSNCFKHQHSYHLHKNGEATYIYRTIFRSWHFCSSRSCLDQWRTKASILHNHPLLHWGWPMCPGLRLLQSLDLSPSKFWTKKFRLKFKNNNYSNVGGGGKLRSNFPTEREWVYNFANAPMTENVTFFGQKVHSWWLKIW
jgi:hypothetical protein